jgi:transcriptional regulator with XRE-family HTH domain
MTNQQRLRDLMQREGLTSRQVAELVGVHQITVLNWMRGKYRVPLAAILLLESTSASPGPT